jgi:hypothetical protein
MAIDSPMTWATIRLPGQPIAFRVPNSRTRRDTAAIVRITATAKAAISTMTESHLPRSLASLAVELSDPVISLARLLGVVIVADGKSLAISCCTDPMSDALSALT